MHQTLEYFMFSLQRNKLYFNFVPGSPHESIIYFPPNINFLLINAKTLSLNLCENHCTELGVQPFHFILIVNGYA